MLCLCVSPFEMLCSIFSSELLVDSLKCTCVVMENALFFLCGLTSSPWYNHHTFLCVLHTSEGSADAFVVAVAAVVVVVVPIVVVVYWSHSWK